MHEVNLKKEHTPHPKAPMMTPTSFNARRRIATVIVLTAKNKIATVVVDMAYLCT
jgi:hypothetical protein